MHQLLGEEQLRWLKRYTHVGLSEDETRALILAKETGAVDNAGLRAISGLDTLAASQVLQRLYHQHHLLEKGGAGPATYYRLADSDGAGDLPLFRPGLSNTGDLSANTGNLTRDTGDLSLNADDLPSNLIELIEELTPKARKEKLWPVLVWLCAIKPRKAEDLAHLLGGRQVTSLKANHINVLRDQEGLLAYLHPEVVNHPEQAYMATPKGLKWLEKLGVPVNE